MWIPCLFRDLELAWICAFGFTVPLVIYGYLDGLDEVHGLGLVWPGLVCVRSAGLDWWA